MRYLPGQPHQLPGNRQQLSDYQAKHFHFEVAAGVATVTLNRPERKNPLTFDSYAELRDLFRAMSYADDIKAVPSQTAKMIDIAQVQGQVHAQSVQKVGELADKIPNETVSILRTWLHESAA